MASKYELLEWVAQAWFLYWKNTLRVIVPNIIIVIVSNILLMAIGIQFYRMVWLILSPILLTGYVFYCLEIYRDSNYNVKHILVVLAKCSWKLWMATLLYIAGVSIGLLCFIVPGVVLAILCSMSLITIVDQNLSPIKAIKHSIEITKNHIGKLVVLYLIGIVSTTLFQWHFRMFIAHPDTYRISIITVGLYAISIFLVVPLNTLLYTIAYKALSGNTPVNKIPVNN